MKVLVDTNVWLDIILKREPHVAASARVVNALTVPDGPHSAWVCAHAVTTIFYIVDRGRDSIAASSAVEALLDGAEVAAVDGKVLRKALTSDLVDFEDAVVESAASRLGLDAILTRNAPDFSRARIPVYTPSELMAALRIS